MTSNRRRSRTRTRTRTALGSLGVVVAVAVLGALLHAGGLLDTDTDTDTATHTDAAPDATRSAMPAPTASSDPTAGAGGGADASSASRPTTATAAPTAPTTDAAAAATARRQLAALPVKGKAPATGYDREARFGTAWLDVDHNGCDTRNDVLARDLTELERQGPCKVLRGTLVSPYTGERVDFVRGNRTSTLVQVDHVVALENAWRTGAQQLSQSEREALANDPVNLFAVDGHSNAQKRSGDAATWLPADTAFRCTYVEHQVTVKTTYRLWVAPAERDAMARVLDRC